VLVPVLPLQFVHEADLGQALLLCVVAAGPPGAYNIAADGILSTADVAREFGLIPLPFPASPARFTARVIAALPFLPPALQWMEAASHPAIMDTSKARRDLGWVPRCTALEALRGTIGGDPARS
jgi:nucleoside-diphosphate-sugar epimerase